MVSISIHLSSISFSPFFVVLFISTMHTLYIQIYPLFLILYFVEAPSSIQPILQLLPIDLARALLNNESGYEVGVTLGKALAITVPWLIYRLSKDLLQNIQSYTRYMLFNFISLKLGFSSGFLTMIVSFSLPGP